MTNAGTAEMCPDTDIADVLLDLNAPLLKYAESPLFQAMARPELPRTSFGSSTVWGVTAEDGAIIYARRGWDEHAAPVGIEGADRIALTLQRPDEITERWLADGVGYHLVSGRRDAWRLRRDGYEAEQCENEVLEWAGVDSPAALVGYIADAIHHGRVYSAMHRTTAKYGALTPKGFIISLFASMEATVKQERSVVDRSLDLAIDAPHGRDNLLPRNLMVAGKITQSDQQDWSLSKLEAFGVRLGRFRYKDAVSSLTPVQLREVRRFGESALRHCEANMRALCEQSEPAQEVTSAAP